MASINLPVKKKYTYEGTVASRISSEMQLRRSVMSCMLWEGTFYEDGVDIANRIANEIACVEPLKVFEIAVEARNKMKLRHVPLFIVREMSRLDKHKYLVSEALEKVIQRPDELCEFLAIYWKDGKQPLSAQVKKGLAKAFLKFNEYELAKYNRDNKAVKLRDVLFLCHAKPRDEQQENLWKRLINDSLETPDTWETQLSGGADKKETFERLMKERKLGGLALLRNLRNMRESNVNEKIIFEALENLKGDKILPFRFISAAKYAPQWEGHIEKAMIKCLSEKEKLGGKTALVIDGSGSMFGTPVSKKSEIDRFEAASALAILLKEICEMCEIVVFSDFAELIPFTRRGFALRDAINSKAPRRGTNIQEGIDLASRYGYDRIVIITDEQSDSPITNPIAGSKGYVVNVAPYKNGIGYGDWIHIDGWSEAIVDYILEFEKTLVEERN